MDRADYIEDIFNFRHLPAVTCSIYYWKALNLFYYVLDFEKGWQVVLATLYSGIDSENYFCVSITELYLYFIKLLSLLDQKLIM